MEELAEALAMNPDDLAAITRDNADLTRAPRRKLAKITNTQLGQWIGIKKQYKKAFAEATLQKAM